MAASFCSTSACTSRASRQCSASFTPRAEPIRAAQCSPTWPIIRRRRVAQKLARHFVADEPPPLLVAKLAKAFMDSDGNLKAVAKALVTADEAWTPARTKLKRPSEWIVSTLRLTAAPWNATAGPWNIGRVLGVQAGLGE